MEHVFVLTRTSGRPKFFALNHSSVMEQSNNSVRVIHIVSFDDTDTKEYLEQYSDIQIVPVERIPRKSTGHFPYNLYFNKMYQQIHQSGWIIHLDDDDIFSSSDAISQMMPYFQPDHLIVWRVKFPDAIRPTNRYFGRSVCSRGFPAICFAFHTKWLASVPLWEDKKGGDSHFVYKLSKLIPKTIWIDKILTEVNYTEHESGCGLGMRFDLK